jgi:hypothetical protein
VRATENGAADARFRIIGGGVNVPTAWKSKTHGFSLRCAQN